MEGPLETEHTTCITSPGRETPSTAAVTLVARILVQPERPHMARVLGMESLQALAHRERQKDRNRTGRQGGHA